MPIMKFFWAIFFIFLTAEGVSAHSSGSSFEAVKHPYIIDVGYEPETITEGDRVVLNFELWKVDEAEARESTDFTRVWTRLEHGGVTMLATGVAAPQFGPTSLLFSAHSPGEWVLHVRYERDDEVIAESSFPFTVSESSNATSSFVRPPLYFILIIGAAFLVLVVLMLRKRISLDSK